MPNKKNKAIILGSATNLISSKNLSARENVKELYFLGGNLSFLEHNLDYFFSSYYLHCVLSILHDKNINVVKFSTVTEDDKHFEKKLIKTFYPEHIGLHPGSISLGIVSTEFNQLVGMTHFATSLGVSEILYSGFDQNNYKYFWQSKSYYIEKIDRLLDEMSLYLSSIGYNLNSLDKKVIENINLHKDNLESFESYKFYNKSIFKSMFSDLESLDIKFRCLDNSGILYEILNEQVPDEN
jgi:hypothetical protein